VLMGAGDDTFVWNPGDGSDTVEGGDGTDKMLFNGANIAEKFDVSANGSRVRFTRDVGNVVMDLNGIENFELRALGGADQVTVNDLTGTDLTRFDVDMRGPNGEADCQGEESVGGVLLEFEPERRFVFTDAFTPGWEPHEPFMVGAFEIEPDGNGTRYRGTARHWTAEGCQPDRSAQPCRNRDQREAGGDGIA